MNSRICTLPGICQATPISLAAAFILIALSSSTASAATANVSSLSLMDVKTGTTLASSISSSSTISVKDLSSRCLSVRAHVGSGTIGSVGFGLGSNSSFATENAAPYDLMGDTGTRGCLKAGFHSVKATPYPRRSRSGTPGTSMSRSFSIVEAPPVASISSLSLVDMKSGAVIASSIQAGGTISVSDLDTKCLSVRANIGTGELGSVGFGLDADSRFAVENMAPYDLMGDDGTRGCLKVGSVSVKATPYSKSSLQGSEGSAVSRTFTIAPPAVSEPYIRKNLLIHEDFEDSLADAYATGSNSQFDFYGEYYRVFRAKDKPYAFGISSTKVRSGGSSARFEMRQSDHNAGVIRSEIAGRRSESDPHRWYGFSLFLPSANWADDSTWNIIAQWNGVPDPGEPARNPPIDLYVSNGRLKLSVKWASAPISSDTDRDGSVVFDLGTVQKDKWLDFVFHIKFSYLSDGNLEVWMNGNKVATRNGPNSYNDQILPFFKIGLYKRHWVSGGSSSRVIYGDSVRVGNGNATYRDVAP